MTASNPGALACGKTIQELSEYLARDRSPRDPVIESCPECLNALSGLAALSEWSHDLLDEDARDLAPPPATWLSSILDNIALEVRSGRDLPIRHPDPRMTVSVTEGAVRALVRAVGGRVPGVVVGSCALEGDAETAGAPVRVDLHVSLAWGAAAASAVAQVRAAVAEALAMHTQLTLTGVDITVVDVHGIADREVRP